MRQRHVPAWLTAWEYAHRGKHGEGVPENSLQGAKVAIEAGLGIECDIQRSSDDHAMVFHDWDLQRLTGVVGDTGETTAAEIGALRYRGTDEAPALLSELLSLIAGRVPILIEIKSRLDYDVFRTCEIVHRLTDQYPGDYAVMSFDPRVAKWFRQNAPAVCAGLVMREDEHGYTQKPWQRRLAFWIARPDFLAYHIDALPSDWVAGLRAQGLPILSWTINSPEKRARALANVDALISEGEGLA